MSWWLAWLCLYYPQETEDQVDECVRMLLEMFPAACTQEVSHCLDRSQGDIEEAAQLILDRQENGLSITPKVPKVRWRSIIKVTVHTCNVCFMGYLSFVGSDLNEISQLSLTQYMFGIILTQLRVKDLPLGSVHCGKIPPYSAPLWICIKFFVFVQYIVSSMFFHTLKYKIFVIFRI